MDEFQHMERFGVDGEFTEGQFIGGEFFYRKRKERRNQSKEEALYGYEESDSDGDDGGSKRRRRDGVMRKADLTKPVAFVSIGTVLPTQEKEEGEGEGEGEEVDGGAGAAPKLGLNGAGRQQGEEGEEEEDDLLPSAFGKRIKEAAERRGREREQAKMKEQARAGVGAGVGGEDIAVFEKHTRGIGMKLLEKMGYKGGGLGKNEQGRATPIEAKLRPKNMGMGFNDFKEAGTGLPPLPTAEQPDEKVKDVKAKAKDKAWSKKNQGRKRHYVSAAELLVQKQEKGFESVQTVLDMRGPQVRVLTNLENLNAQPAVEYRNTPFPELQHNLRLIVDLAEADIQVCDRKLRHEKDTVILLEKERVRLQAEADLQRQQIEAMEAIMGGVDRIQQAAVSGSMTLEEIAASFQSMQVKHKDDFKIYNVGIMALAVALPRMIAHFRGWEPFKDPLHGTDIVRLWRRVLQGEDPRDVSIFADAEGPYAASPSNPYSHLVAEAVLPAVRMAAVNRWEPRDPEPMLRFLEAWDKLLPPSLLQDVLEHLVMPKLTAAVDAWDPRVETVPIHAWLHPWLPLLGTRMEPLYLPICFKLGSALQAWHPSDTSALALLYPWQTVFDPASWEQLLVRSIFPKLMYALQELVINPAHQQFDQFNWVMAWASAAPVHHMAGMLEVGFFPKWQQVLYHWLCSSPKFDEVTQWFLGWKSLLPPQLLANDRIERQFNIAMDMMNQAVDGMPVVQPGAREALSQLRASQQQQYEAQQQQQQQQQQEHAPTSYAQQRAALIELMENGGAGASDIKKADVEYFAEQNDVQFLPKVGRMHEGLQVYGFGSISMCIDTSHQTLPVLALVGDRWNRLSLDELLEMHRSKTGGSRWK